MKPADIFQRTKWKNTMKTMDLEGKCLQNISVSINFVLKIRGD